MEESSKHRIVVIGGGYAGLTTAARIGENAPSADIILVDAKDRFVERIRLHEVAGGSTERHLPYADFMTARNGRFVQARVMEIDTAAGNIRLAPGAIDTGTIAYDTLVYAPGSYTDMWTVPGVDRFATGLDTLEGCREMAAQLEALAKSGGRVLIAGGGLTAIEAACEFGERLTGLNIVMAPGRNFGPGDTPGALSQAGFDHVAATLRRLDVDIISGARITRLEADHAVLENGDTIAFNLCLWAAGFLVPDLAAKAGIQVTTAGRIVTDETLASVSHPDILAVGDAAYVATETAGECRMSCAAGRPMGERAARTILSRLDGAPSDPFEFSYSFRCISLGREDGLIQFVDTRDRPVEQVWTGKRGAVWKEYICRRTLAGVGFDSPGDLGPPPDTPPQIG